MITSKTTHSTNISYQLIAFFSHRIEFFSLRNKRQISLKIKRNDKQTSNETYLWIARLKVIEHQKHPAN